MSATAFQRRRREAARLQAEASADTAHEANEAKDANDELREARQEPSPAHDALKNLSRPELNALASEKGVEEPEKLGNKNDVIEAIQSSQATQ